MKIRHRVAPPHVVALLTLITTGCATARPSQSVGTAASPVSLPAPTVARVLSGYLGLRLQMTGEQVRLVICDASLDATLVTAALTPLREKGTVASFRFDPSCQASDAERTARRASAIHIESISMSATEATLVARRYRADGPREWREVYHMVDWRPASLTIDRIDTSVD